ncbi:hypothetical protein HHI36_013396 [Cryptolaemus montrouzieri]|uniref:Uncharacterized protein n=1 Tax=Cryptolaemus montrouzieri TaxID=559131 RepID=A0ABD2NIC6_9CUCU
MPPSAADKIKQYREFRQTALRRLQDINEIALNTDEDENKKFQLKMRCLTVDLVYEDFGIQHNHMLQHISLQEDAEEMLAAEELVLQEADQSYFNIKATYYKLFEQDKEQSEVRSHYSNIHGYTFLQVMGPGIRWSKIVKVFVQGSGRKLKF